MAIVVDRALDSMRDRTVVSAPDVVDLLLDLRSSLMATVEVELEEAAAREDRARHERTTWSETTRRAATSGLSRRSRSLLPLRMRHH